MHDTVHTARFFRLSGVALQHPIRLFAPGYGMPHTPGGASFFVPQNRGLMNYFQITKCDMLNGEGIRVVLWVAGCSHHCKGCQNAYTWDAKAGLPFTDETKQELFDALSKDYIHGITFSGGDPLYVDNRETIANLIKEIKQKFPDKTIWLYTGYQYEDLKKFKEIQPVLSDTDVIVDGPFIEELKDIDYPWAGSKNQRVLTKEMRNQGIL